MIIRKMKTEDAEEVAKLHIETIKGFISDLGLNFVKNYYVGICSSKEGFGYVCEENDKIKGFTAGTTDIISLYKKIIFKRGIILLFSLKQHLLRFSIIKKIIQAIFRPLRAKLNFTKAEWLFAGVKKGLQKEPFGQYLADVILREFRKRGIQEVKVFVREKNTVGDKYILRQGFESVTRVRNCGEYLNLYLKQL